MGGEAENPVKIKHLIDAHVHVGRFNDSYYSPEYISTLMKMCGVDYYNVSSTSICNGDVYKSINDIISLMTIDRERVFPCLWLTEAMLRKNTLEEILQLGIPWKCLKIHPVLHPQEWVSNGKQFRKLIALGRQLSVPILIHTGFDSCCRACKYEDDIKANNEVNFILAHGRPFNEALKMLHKYDNVYVDTSFMPIDETIRFLTLGPTERILWGSDTPIPLRFYNMESYQEYYFDILNQIHTKVNQEVFNRFTYDNARKLFSL